MIKSIYHCLPMWVWEVAVIVSYLGLFLISVLVAIVAIGGDEEDE